ncbi:MAG: hypothetical protein ACOH2R_14090 [Pseudomonas sp.]
MFYRSDDKGNQPQYGSHGEGRLHPTGTPLKAAISGPAGKARPTPPAPSR